MTATALRSAGRGWWGLEGPEYLAWLDGQPESDWPIPMGATTYRIMAEFAAQGEPGTESLNAAQKYVVSSTLTDPLGWPDATIIDGDLQQLVARLKESGATLRTMGSLSLCRSLLVAGLVDRFRVVVFPVITGATGRDNIYRGYPDVMLELLHTLDGRLQLLEYRATVLDGPPGT